MNSRIPTYGEYKPSGVEWLGEIPKHWLTSQLKWITPVKRGASPRPIDDMKYFDVSGEYAWVRISDVSSSNVYLETTEERLSDLGSSLSVKIEPGELFLSIAGSVGKACISKIKACIHDGFVYFPLFNGNKKWLYYIFDAKLPFGGLGKLGTQLNLNTDTVGSIYLPLPPNDELDSISLFLDRETAKIDELIQKQEKLIELIEENRSATIDDVVLNCGNGTQSQWEMKKIKYLLKRNGIVRGPFGGDLKREIFVSSGVKVYEQKNAIYQDCNLGDSFISEEKFEVMRRFEVFADDYLMSCSGTIGKTYRVPTNAPKGIINQALMIIRFNESLDKSYLDWVLIADFFKSQILDNSQGGAMKNLVGIDIFKGISLPVPPLCEQKKIANLLEKKMGKFDRLSLRAKKSVELLKERRASLISAAITGKIDVRKLA